MKIKFYALKLVAVCIIIFIIQLMLPVFTDLFVLNQSAFTQPWKFVSAIFLHGSPGHLLYNMFALALFGTLLEQIVGRKKFMLIFFGAGIFANIISINFYGSSLGASGAIYGIIGALMIIRPFLMVWAFGVPMPMILAGIFWALGDFVGIFTPSNVANIAHLAGMALGIFLGIFFRKNPSNYERKNEKIDSIQINENSMRAWEDNYLK